MTTAAQCIRMTNDGEHVIVAGTYPPCVRCYTVSDMAMKFHRGLTSEVVTFQSLSDDYGKIVFLQNDRTLNFHAPYGEIERIYTVISYFLINFIIALSNVVISPGTHYSIRVPKFGRDLSYNWANCDLFVCGSGDEIYRLNLELGQFREPFQLSYNGGNKLCINNSQQMLACGGEGAICDFYDIRARKRVATIDLVKYGIVEFAESNKPKEITALKFDTDGLTLAMGTSQGHALLFDIRSSRPITIKEHQYGEPIVDITYHNSGTSKQVRAHLISINSQSFRRYYNFYIVVVIE